MRHTAVSVLLLAIGVSACEIELISSEGSDEPGTLDGWSTGSAGSIAGDCPAYDDHAYLAGTSATDQRPWAVGADVWITAWFHRPCGFFRPCLPMKNVRFESSDPEVLTPNGHWTTGLVAPRVLVDANASGSSRVSVSVDGRDFGSVELGVVTPTSLRVQRLLREYGFGTAEPLTSVAVASNGFVRVWVTVFGQSGVHLCGHPTASVQASGVTVTNDEPLPQVGLRLNDGLMVRTDSSTGPAAFTVTLNDISKTVNLNVVAPMSISHVAASMDGAWSYGVTHIRIRALAGQQEVSGALLHLRNLTPSVYGFSTSGSAQVDSLDTRESLVWVYALPGRESTLGKVEVTVVGSPVAPAVIDFTVP